MVELDVIRGAGFNFAKPRAMTEAEIAHAIVQSGFAARQMREVGFTGITRHAAHGYLISQFLSPLTGMARSAEKATLLTTRGIASVAGALDDPDILTGVAQAADVVVYAASADHPGLVVTLVTALERSAKTLIQTTGSSIVAQTTPMGTMPPRRR